MMIPDRLARLGRMLGFRGGFLALLAAYDAFYGWYLLKSGAFLGALLIPEHTWGWIWLGVAVLLLYGATRSADRWFYALATGLKVAWALEFFRLQVSEHIPLQWLRGSYYLALAAIVMLVAAWPEPGHKQ